MYTDNRGGGQKNSRMKLAPRVYTDNRENKTCRFCAVFLDGIVPNRYNSICVQNQCA